MNTPIRRMFGVIVLMFTALMASTAWWTVVRAEELSTDYGAQNRRDLLRGIKIDRGTIRAADGTVIAKSDKDSEGVYERTYPEGDLFGHPVGYSFTSRGQVGVEAFYNRELSGGASATDEILEQLVGSREGGDELRTTLDARAQRLAIELLTRANPRSGGSAVVLDPRTGAVRVMASVPGYDPNDIPDSEKFKELNTDETRRPLVNRALQFGYAPGSTFKVVTLSAAIDSGTFKPGDTIDGTNDVPISGVPLPNSGGASYGNIDLRTALAESVNTAFAQIGERVGQETMREYMRRFGFESKPQLDYPKGEMSAAGEYRNGELIPVTSRFVDVGRMAIGQDKLQVPALQMALVAAAVANDGELMKPHIGDRFVDADGRTTKRIEDEVQSEVMSPETAAFVTEAMIANVNEGTGTAAQIPGVQVAGKTGTAETAETGAGTENNLWFIGFAPADDPEVAFAVTVQDVVGFGGDVAAPIAKQLVEGMLE